MISSIPNMSLPPVGYAMAQGSKMSLHVDPASLIYSHFQYVSGIAAPEGTQGVTISKLNLLDVLIGQLNQIKKGEEVLFQVSAESEMDTLDALIVDYTEQIRQAKSASDAMPYMPSPSAQSGIIFSLFA